MNNELIHAIQYLRGKGIVNRDKDIAEKTGYNKTTVSSYINGTYTPSRTFIEAFENAFSIKLADFKSKGEKEQIQHPDAMQLISENVLVLKAEHQTNRQLLIEILSAVTHRSVSEVQLMADKILSHNLERILHELKQESV